MHHLYVSGPMNGIEEHNFPAFGEAAGKLRASGYRVTSPHEVALPCGCSGPKSCESEQPHVWSEYLRADLLAMLAYCDAVATLPGWSASRGAQLEVTVAESLGWPVQSVGYWLGDSAVVGLRPGELMRSTPPPPPEYRISNPGA